MVLLVGAGATDLCAVCRRAASAARLLLKECDLPQLESMMERCRPLVVVFTHETYAQSPVQYDQLVRDAGAKLLRVDPDDLDPADLEPLLASAALDARRSRETLAPPSGVRTDRASRPGPR